MSAESESMLPDVTIFEFSEDDIKKNAYKSRKRYNLCICLILTLVILLQFVSLVTPGWLIVKYRLSFNSSMEAANLSTYESVYYTIVCVEDVCKTRSKLHDYIRTTDDLAKSNTGKINADYNVEVHFQVGLQMSWIFVVGAFIIQIVKTVKGKDYSGATIISGICVTTACVLMIERLYDSCINILHARALVDDDGGFDINIGFPYALFLFGLSFLESLLVAVLIWKQLYRYILDICGEANRASVKAETDKKQFELENKELTFKIRNNRASWSHHDDYYRRNISRDRRCRSSERLSYKHDINRQPKPPLRGSSLKSSIHSNEIAPTDKRASTLADRIRNADINSSDASNDFEELSISDRIKSISKDLKKSMEFDKTLEFDQKRDNHFNGYRPTPLKRRSDFLSDKVNEPWNTTTENKSESGLNMIAKKPELYQDSVSFHKQASTILREKSLRDKTPTKPARLSLKHNGDTKQPDKSMALAQINMADMNTPPYKTNSLQRNHATPNVIIK